MVFEVERCRADTFQPRQVLEKRIAWARHEHRVSRIAQQLEQPRVGFARARREDDVLGIDRDAAPRMIAGDRLARRWQPEGVRLVPKGGIRRQRREQIGRIRASPRASDWTRSDR